MNIRLRKSNREGERSILCLLERKGIQMEGKEEKQSFTCHFGRRKKKRSISRFFFHFWFLSEVVGNREEERKRGNPYLVLAMTKTRVNLSFSLIFCAFLSFQVDKTKEISPLSIPQHFPFLFLFLPSSRQNKR